MEIRPKLYDELAVDEMELDIFWMAPNRGTKVTEGALGKLGLDQVAIHFPAEARFRSGTGYFGATRLGTKREIYILRGRHTQLEREKLKPKREGGKMA